MEKVQPLKSVCGFFSCYLLSSLNPRGKGRTYIGFTVNPARRIRQHNGDIMHGAHKTRKLRPWEMVVVVYGFPTKVDALKFEWAWQNPCRSKAVKEAAASIKSLTGVKGKLQILFSMLGLPSWSSMPITVSFLSTQHLALRLKCASLPPCMRSLVAPLSELPRGSTGEEGEEEEELGDLGEDSGRGEEEEGGGEVWERRFRDLNERNWMAQRGDEEVDVGGGEKGWRKRGSWEIDVPERRGKRRGEEDAAGLTEILKLILPDVMIGDGVKIDEKIREKEEKGEKAEKKLKTEKGEKIEKKVKREKGEKGEKTEIKVKREKDEMGEKTDKKEKKEKGGKGTKGTQGKYLQGQAKGEKGGRDEEADRKLGKRGSNVKKKEAGDLQREAGNSTNFKRVSSEVRSRNFRLREEENISFFEENCSKTSLESFDDLNEMELLFVPSFNFLYPSQKEENNSFLLEDSNSLYFPPKKVTKNGISFHQTSPSNLHPTTVNKDRSEVLVEELPNWNRMEFEKENISPAKVKKYSENSFPSVNRKILSFVEQPKATVNAPPVIDLSFFPSSASPPSPSPSFPSSFPTSTSSLHSGPSSPPPLPPISSSPRPHFSPLPQMSCLNDSLNSPERNTFWDDRFYSKSCPASLSRIIGRDSGPESESATWCSDQVFERNRKPTNKARAVDMPAGYAPKADVRSAVSATAAKLSVVPDVQILSGEELAVVRTVPVQTVLREEDEKKQISWGSYREGSSQVPIGTGRFGNVPAVSTIGEEEEEELIEMGPGWHEALQSGCRKQRNRRCHGKGGKQEEKACNVGESREFTRFDAFRVQPPLCRPSSTSKPFLEDKKSSQVYINDLIVLSTP